MIDWTHWHNEPLLVGTIVFAVWAYLLATGPWRHRVGGAKHPSPRGERISFVCGVGLFYLAVGSPLDHIGERFLFAAHMAQHMIITYAVAPLLLRGLPWWLVDAALDRPVVRNVARVALAPLVTALAYVLTVSLWHVPAAYDYALRDKFVHVVQHLHFLAVSMLFWWPLAGPSRLVPPRPPGVQVLYVFSVGVLQFPLVAFLNFTREPLYPTYAFAPRIIDLSPREDQVLGGAMMGVGGMFIALGLIGRAFYQWSRQADESEPSPASSLSRS
jgi:putative membrane protein